MGSWSDKRGKRKKLSTVKPRSGVGGRGTKEQENWSTVDGPPSSEKSIFTPKGYWR